MRFLSCGGRWGNPLRGHIENQVERNIHAGVSPDVAKRFVESLQFGGCSTEEALALIRDKDCAPYGTGLEAWSVVDLPQDTWFRDAWRRSHNGGPIGINMKVARTIQLKRINAYAKKINADIKVELWRNRIRKAETPEFLKSIFP